jgi:cytochrome c-type biogenesis protein CcmH/NrfG
MSQKNSMDELATLEEKVASQPGSFEDSYALATAYADQGRWLEAIETYKTAISLDPTNAEPYNDLGVA